MAAKKATSAAHRKPTATRGINLALQGGGAHGAFTWGVLDRLLDEEDLEIRGISGTSAGAMNAAVLADGYHEGGRARAKAQLHEFWYEISAAATLMQPFGQLGDDTLSAIPGFAWLSALNPADMMTRVFSPYEYNPLNYNPLRDVLERVLDVKALQNGIPLFVTATNVETGEARVFRGKEITIDVLLASACLPFMYQAVEIEGVPYWDGGYVGNPAIWPLIYKTGCEDVLLVQINPLKRSGTPKNALDIINRVNEISFNSSLIAEMRAINFVRKLIASGKLDSHDYANMRMHRVMPPPDLREMNASSKMNAHWDFFQLLFTVGRNQMDEWLKTNKKSIGHESTLDIEEHFLTKHKKHQP
ncbi:MAG: patatin-like phospholipase family protein [Pseudomonadota bacterium]